MLLRDEPIDLAVSSDLSRAAETARIILAGRPVPLRLDPDWREMQYGAWEGLRWDDIVARTPGLAGKPSSSVRAFAPPGGENFDRLCRRVERATARVVAELRPDGTALIATHAGPLHALLHTLLGERTAEALQVRFNPATITRFLRAGAAWELMAVNEAAAPKSCP